MTTNVQQKQTQQWANKLKMQIEFNEIDECANFKFTWAQDIKTNPEQYKQTTIKEIEEYIKRGLANGIYSGFEILTGAVVPYYDFDPKYNDENEQKSKILSDYKKYFAKIDALYPKKDYPKRKIIAFCSAGPITDKNGVTKYKNSFHFIVRGVGRYSCGLQVPQIPFDGTKEDENDKADSSVYKAKDAQQKWRMPYCSKTHEDKRIFKRCYLKPSNKDELLILNFDDCTKIGEHLGLYMVQNIGGETLKPDCVQLCKMVEVAPKTEKTFPPSFDENDLTRLMIEFVNGKERCVAYENWIIMLTLIKTMQLKYDFDYETCVDIADTISSEDQKGYESRESVKLAYDTINPNWQLSEGTIWHWIKEDAGAIEYLRLRKEFNERVKRETLENVVYEMGDVVAAHTPTPPESQKNINFSNVQKIDDAVCDVLGEFANIIAAHVPTPTHQEMQNGTAANLQLKTVSEPEPQKQENIKFSDPDTLPTIETTDHTFNKRDPFVWIDFVQKYHSMRFSSCAEAVQRMRRDLRRVLVLILKGRAFYVKKDDCNENLFSIVDKLNKKSGNDFPIFIGSGTSKKGDPISNQFYLSELIERERGFICKYATVAMKPNKSELKENQFNIWGGILAKESEIVMEELQPFLDYIKEVLASDDENIYQWLLGYFAVMMHQCHLVTQIALFFNGSQGTGKSTMMDFLIKYIFGRNVGVSFSGTECIMQKHNTIISGKRLCVVEEMSSTNQQTFKNLMNKMKDYITNDNGIVIEPKGIDSFMVDNISTWIFISNFEDALSLEKTDRRFVCLEVSNKYLQNVEYFEKLKNKCFNQRIGDMFYTYLKDKIMTLKDLIKNKPFTKLKERIIEYSTPSYETFFEHAINGLPQINKHLDEEIKELGDLASAIEKKDGAPAIKNTTQKVGSAAFYSQYKTWCQESGIMPESLTKFGMHAGKRFKHEMVRGVKYYTIERPGA